MDMPTCVFRAKVYTAPESMDSMVASSSWCSSIRSASLGGGGERNVGEGFMRRPIASAFDGTLFHVLRCFASVFDYSFSLRPNR